MFAHGESWRRLGAVLVSAAVLAACDDDGATGPNLDETGDDFATFTVDAREAWAFVDLDGKTATQVTVADPTSSTAWDIAFLGTNVMLNGGAAGPGGVVGYCICQNAGATPAQIMAMTAESELADFRAVTAASIPADDAEWEDDALAPAITGWWSYDMTTHRVSADPSRAWKVRAAEETNPVYAKFRVVDIDAATATQQNAGRITIEFAVQPGAGQPMGPVQTAVIDVRNGRVYFDLATASVSDASDWDLAFEGYTIRLNSGVSGSGNAGAVLEILETFEEMADASNAPASTYAADSYGGVFKARPWYRYNLTGNDHTIWPTYDVYLIKRGDEVYKLQIINYYNTVAEARHITARFAPLTD